MPVKKNRLIDSGFKWIFDDRKLRQEIKDARVKVGVLAGTEHGDETYDNGLTVVENATIHEFGTDTVPARSFARSAYDDTREELANDGKQLMRAILQRKITIAGALDVLGAKLARAMKNKILSGLEPPLAESTMARRRTARASRPLGFLPLIDTKRLIRAITWVRVIDGQETEGGGKPD